jgi:hypothetical protein
VGLTDQEVEQGFWNADISGFKTGEGFIKHHREPTAESDQEHLSVSCTQLGDAKVQKRAVAAWCEALPRMRRVRRVWFPSRVPQVLFDAACRIPDLEGMWVKWSGPAIKSLAALERCPQLRHLHIGSSSQVRDLSPVARLPALEVLELEAFTRAEDLSPLTRLPKLEELGFFGSMWTTVKVPSVEPFSRIETLRRLDIGNLRAAASASFRELARLGRLEALVTAAWWSDDDVRYVRERLPRLRYPAGVWV